MNIKNLKKYKGLYIIRDDDRTAYIGVYRLVNGFVEIKTKAIYEIEFVNIETPCKFLFFKWVSKDTELQWVESIQYTDSVEWVIPANKITYIAPV
jgi:hypothetical protein